MATQMPSVAQFSLPTPGAQPQNNTVAPAATAKGMPPVAQFSLPQGTQSQSQPQDLGLLGQALSSPIGQGIAEVAKSIETPFISAAAKPVQYLAKAIGQPDPYASGVPTIAGNVVPNSPTLEHTVGDVAQVGSYFVPGEGVLGAAGMGALQGAGNAMSQGQDLTGVATQGVEGTALGAGGAAAAKLGGGLLSKVGDLVSGDAATKAIQGIKDAYGSALNLNASQRAYETRSGKDLAQVLLDNSAPLGRYSDGTLDSSGAINKLQTALDPLNAQAKQLLSSPQGVVKNVSLPDTLTEINQRIQNLSVNQAEKNTAIQHATELMQAEMKQYGTDVSPETADQIKQGFWGSSFKGKLTSADKLQGNVSYLAGNTLKKSIEDSVAGTDAGNVLPKINQQRSDLVDAIKRLSTLDGVQKVKGGALGNMMGGVVGSIAGAASGLGPLGAIGGDVFGQKASELLQNPATKIALAQGKAKAAGLIPGLLGNVAQPIGSAISKTGSAISKSARLAGLVGNTLTTK